MKECEGCITAISINNRFSQTPLWQDQRDRFEKYGLEEDDSDANAECVGRTEECEEELSCSNDEDTGLGSQDSFRMIERYFPSEAVSKRSQRERYQRGKTAHTIFTWWARRPFAAACAIVTTSLIECKELQEETRELVDEYCASGTSEPIDPSLTSRIAADDQRVLDLFGGGGTIPIEAGRLGARVYSVENNELAHFTQTALLQLSQQGPGLADKVHDAGQKLLQDLFAETESFFPARDAGEEGRTIAYLWSREVQCKKCQGWLSLMRRPWISKQNGRNWYMDRSPLPKSAEFSIQIRKQGQPSDKNSAWIGSRVQCPFCQEIIERRDMDAVMSERSRDRLLVSCTSQGRAKRTRKNFAIADEEVHLPTAEILESAIAADLEAMQQELPAGELPRWSGVTNPSLYGMARHTDLFNLRQRAVLVRFCRVFREHYRRWCDEIGQQKADVVAAFLSGLIDQLVDWNSRLATWISQNEQVGRGLSGPGMAMVWDHVEIDPLEEAPANLWDKLDRIIQGMQAIPTFRHRPVVLRGDARDLPFESDSFDIIATDPPYFDNIFYNVLADCVYVWKRLALDDIFPAYFRAGLTDSSRELTMNRHIHGDIDRATEYYTEGMEEVFREARRVLRPRGVLSLIFAHSTVEGWASIVAAMIRAGLKLEAAWPMYIERRHRPRGMSSRAINTSFVLVAKTRLQRRRQVEWKQFDQSLRHRLESEDEKLDLDEKYGPNTRGRTLFGLGISLYSQTGKLVDDDREVKPEEAVERIANVIETMVGDQAWGVRRS